MADLRPPLLDEYGLEAALRWYGEEFARRIGVPLAVESAPALPGLRPEAAVALFRIAQEALNNIAKHAAARSIKVTSGHAQWRGHADDRRRRPRLRPGAACAAGAGA